MSPFALSKLGLNGKMPRPFVVVHSGNTQMMLLGFASTREARVTSFESSWGTIVGGANARRIALKSVIRSTLRLFGYERVKMGWKIPAR